MEICMGEGTTSSRSIGPERSVATAIALELAAFRDENPMDIAPLSESINTDALNAFFWGSDADFELNFTHEGCAVTVSSTEVSVARE
ncbi:HalOD1 output domain-containing protein [Haloarcula amylovorans]|uniref:HalOD1 output domain-containing protein n=1 Tax=Haloarcula amylovorans TaxID=2562280 RepID=UPI0010765EC9|nr:HalOD1 output domain-containing protein [Halomicroarcula amylolytica]